MADLATLGVVVTTSGAQEAAQQLDKLASAGRKAAASSETMAAATKTSLGDTGMTWRRFVAERMSDYMRLEGGHAGAMKRMGAEWKDYKAGLTGVAAVSAQAAPAAQAVVASVARIAPAMGGAAKSAKQLVNAQRQLPAQFTDIAVGLASSQAPLTVLLQQGGQIKDIFGGVGPALRATAGYVVGLINPVTVLAAAAVGLALAWKQATGEMEAFNRALIFTGQSTFTTADDLRTLADEIDNTTSASERQAASVIARVAATGRFTEEQLRAVSVAAIELDNISQQAIEDTIAQYVKLAQDPVDALLKLNDTQNFLTRETLAQIQSLKDQGREAEATQLAIETLSRVQIARAAEARRSLSALSLGWIEVKSVASEAFDLIADGFREADSGVKDFLDSLKLIDPEISKAASKIPQLGFFGRVGAAVIRRAGRDAGTLEDTTGDNIRSEQIKEQQKAEEELAKDREKWFRDSIRYGTEREKLETEVLEAIAEGNRLGLERVQIEARVAAIREDFARRQSKKGRNEAERESLRLAREAQRERDRLKKEAERAEESLGNIIRQNAADLAGPAAQAARQYANEMLNLLGIEQDLAAAGLLLGDQERELAIARQQANETYEDRLRVINEQKTAAEQLIEDMEFELRLMGLSNVERQKEINLRYAGADATDEQKEAIRRLTEEQERAINAARGLDVVRESTQGLFEDLMNGSKSAKEAFADFVDSILAGIARIVAEKLTAQLFGDMGSSGGGLFGGSSDSGLGGLFSALFSGGGRAIGGPVSKDSIYQVAEKGQPEVLDIRGKQYLIPGADGNVTPLREGTTGGGQNIQQNIYVTGTVDPRSAYQVQREAQLELRMAASR